MSDATNQLGAGDFCWFELMTTDTAAAKQFYSGLFGWEPNDVPAGPDMQYTIFRLGGKDVSATYKMMADQQSMGIPPNWMIYIMTDSVETTAARATELGGTVLMGPFDVMDKGRMAVVKDPTGAVFSLWQAVTHSGAISGIPNTFCWGELSTSDTSAGGEFYKSLLGWTAKESDAAGMVYTEFMNKGKPIGGMMKLMDPSGNIPPHWLLYFMVDDCDQTAEKATAAGGSFLVPPTDIPNVGRFSVLRDPQGAVFAIIKLAPHA